MRGFGMRRWGLLLLLFFVVAPTYAQSQPPSSLPALFSVRGVLSSSTDIVLASSSVIRRPISWGTRVRYVGTLVLGAAAVYAALDYFYRSVSSQVEPSLDTWYYWGQVIPLHQWDMALLSYHCDSYFGKIFWRYTYPHAGRTFDTPLLASCPGPAPEAAQQYLDSRYPSSFVWISGQGKRYEVSQGVFADAPPYLRVGSLDRPPLSDWLASHPGAAEAVKNTILPAWLEKRFQEPLTFGDPAPGLSFEPAPNVNQWFDDPYRSPYVDTDRDGWPDWIEARLGTDPSNPSLFPDRSGDADGDGYTNWEEALAGTDPLDPASYPRSNPDADLDGVPDSADPCPQDPSNSCGDLSVPLPQQPTFPDLRTPELPDIWGQLLQYIQEKVSGLRGKLSEKFPFGISSWIPRPSYGETSCPSVRLALPEISPVDIPYCDNVFWDAARTYLRPVLLVLGYVAFGFLVVRRSLGVT